MNDSTGMQAFQSWQQSRKFFDPASAAAASMGIWIHSWRRELSRMGMMPGEYSSGMGGATSGMMPPPSHNPHHSGHYSTNNGDLHRNVPSSNTAASSYSKRIVPAGGTATARRSSNISKGPFTTLQDPIYPTLLSSIYNAIMNLLQRHLHSCHMVPSHVMETTHHLPFRWH